MGIRAALIDMDGTIFDSKIDWLRLRDQIRIPWDGRAILAQLADAAPDVRERGLALLEDAERDGAENGELIPGTHDLLDLLRRRLIRCALITNNSRRSAETVLRRYALPFDMVLTRDDGPTKPDPTGFTRALAELQAAPQEAVAIGDAHLDVIAAYRAGIAEIILVGSPRWMADHIPDDIEHHVASDLSDVRRLIGEMLDDHGGVELG